MKIFGTLAISALALAASAFAGTYDTGLLPCLPNFSVSGSPYVASNYIANGGQLCPQIDLSSFSNLSGFGVQIIISTDYQGGRLADASTPAGIVVAAQMNGTLAGWVNTTLTTKNTGNNGVTGSGNPTSGIYQSSAALSNYGATQNFFVEALTGGLAQEANYQGTGNFTAFNYTNGAVGTVVGNDDEWYRTGSVQPDLHRLHLHHQHRQLGHSGAGFHAALRQRSLRSLVART